MSAEVLKACSARAHSGESGLRSMTGFGRAEAAWSHWTFCVEISSVNRRQFDCAMTLPRELNALEAPLVTCIREWIQRGYVKLGLRMAQASGSDPNGLHPKLNLPLARGYLEVLRAAAHDLDLPDRLDARLLTTLPGVLSLDMPVIDSAAVWPAVEKACRAALADLDRMRVREGRKLRHDLKRRVRMLKRVLAVIGRLAPKTPSRYRETLLKRLRHATLPIATDDPALLREVALFADRCDISEERIRLGSHLDQLVGLIDGPEPCGRPLDFLCQECFREINTIGSKSADAAITREVVRFKSELEAVREQAQNIQ